MPTFTASIELDDEETESLHYLASTYGVPLQALLDAFLRTGFDMPDGALVRLGVYDPTALEKEKQAHRRRQPLLAG